ncbi:MAG TPA: substrate-binding domain-containing protein, partial [Polyangia bacterium]
QLKDIFTGKVTNWKEIGGSDSRIIVYSRENSSGTYVFFKDVVLQGRDFSPRAQTMPGTASVVNAVSKETNGIGYGGAAYAKGIKILKVKKDAGSAGVAPDLSTVQAGTYPLARPLFFYLRNKPAGDIKSFVDYVLSDEGQKVVSTVGYYPIK